MIYSSVFNNLLSHTGKSLRRMLCSQVEDVKFGFEASDDQFVHFDIFSIEFKRADLDETRNTPFFTFVSQSSFMALKSNIFTSPFSYPAQTARSVSLCEFPRIRCNVPFILINDTESNCPSINDGLPFFRSHDRNWFISLTHIPYFYSALINLI